MKKLAEQDHKSIIRIDGQIIKDEIAKLIHNTEDVIVLEKVLGVLHNGPLYGRIQNEVMCKNQHAHKFEAEIKWAFESSNHHIDEKNEFIDRYASGVLDIEKMIDGKPHHISRLTISHFASYFFKELSKINKQGTGPGEAAIAIMNPNVQWIGMARGGGDVIVNGLRVEIKTTMSKGSGGRWVNTRKAKLDVQAVARVIYEATEKVSGTRCKILPDRTTPEYWVESIRPLIFSDPVVLEDTAKKMADYIFPFVDNTQYINALIFGNQQNIINSMLEIGFANYKKYSGFDGILMIDGPTETLQYFSDYESLRKRTKIVSGPYIYGPETEIMPKVCLLPITHFE